MEALLYKRLENDGVQCHLCNHRCKIKPGRRGICQVRQNNDGRLDTLVYGQVIARNVDPIEKKPLFHLLPGSRSYSIATVGCNFSCRFCQNADIAQMPKDRDGLVRGSLCSPEEIVADASRNMCATIAYTYTEPTVYFEFALETAKIAHSRGIKNVFVSNGYMTPEAIDMIGPYLDAANVDLKAYTEAFYKKQCGARLAPVKESLVKLKQTGVMVEVTTLLIPGLNDDPSELRQLAEFLVKELGPETPWHISRFHPTYQLTDRSVTPVGTLRAAASIGKAAGLHYVYTGNVPGEDGESTICHHCGTMLIERWGFDVRQNRIDAKGACPQCGTAVYGTGMSS